MQNKAKLVWIEKLRVVSAFGILFYHTSLYYSGFILAPTPNGLSDNWQTLQNNLTGKFGDGFNALAGMVSAFGYQFLDVFIVLIGLTLALSWREEESYTDYLKRRCLRILWPFWLAVLLNLALFEFDNYLHGAYIAPSWNWFAAFTFPMAFDFHGRLLQHINGPWWFVPFMLSVIVISPFMLRKMEVWGTKNFLLFFGLFSWCYRLFSIYVFGGHPNYSMIASAAKEDPFLLLPAKIFLIALGMMLAKLIKDEKRLANRYQVFFIALLFYIIGFIAQFYWFGWTIAEFFYAPAIVMLFYAAFSHLKKHALTEVITKLGALSYSFFLMHNFFAGRFIKYLGTESITSFWQTIGLATLFSLLTAMLIDKLIPIASNTFCYSWTYIDQKLTLSKTSLR
jgi:peptidoglycan/LPS O-acetylase OafA/YrhL